jgi:hypothetical protein
MRNFLRRLILSALGIADLPERMKDVQRHFITKRDPQGTPTETLEAYLARSEKLSVSHCSQRFTRRGQFEPISN